MVYCGNCRHWKRRAKGQNRCSSACKLGAVRDYTGVIHYDGPSDHIKNGNMDCPDYHKKWWRFN